MAAVTGLYYVDGASRDVSSIADTHALPALVVLLVASALLVLWLRRSGHTDRSFGVLFAWLASISLIVAVTLLRGGWPQHFSVERLTEWSTTGLERLRSDPFGSSQFILNVLLFAPAGFAWTWMARRPVMITAALVSMSIIIEFVQAITGLGAPDVADLLANGIGVLVGVGTATLVAGARRHRSQGALSPRQKWMVAAAVLGLAAVALTLVLVGADHQQRALRRELQTAFAGSTKADIDRWNADGTMLQEVFDAVSVRADGAQYSPDQVTVRYPASFFGLHRCVFAIWTPTSVRFELGSGDACTDFIG